MNASEFIAEFYRRRDEIVSEPDYSGKAFEEVSRMPAVQELTCSYRSLLPSRRDARILDIGFGNGEFMAAAVLLGYTNVEGADFGNKQGFRSWSPSIKAIHTIETDIPNLLRALPGKYDFIHLSHLIEHIPKYDMLTFLDAFHDALSPEGLLFIRTPNMDGPKPASSRYVTLTHELGFNSASIEALLQVCRFGDISFHKMVRPPLSLRQRVVQIARSAMIAFNRFQHRMFGAYTVGGTYSEELVVSARPLPRPL